jgi:hypothetical protein
LGTTEDTEVRGGIAEFPAGGPRAEFSDATWAEYRRRWDQGAYRAGFFHEMILADARRLGPRPTLLDIGCGSGLDGDAALQQSLAEIGGRYVGIEPEPTIPVGPGFTEIHRCVLEDAPLGPASIDVAFAAFVLEHLRTPAAFWSKLFEALSVGGVFWGFTIDLRHFFGLASILVQASGLKPWYLNRVRGRGSLSEVATYPAYYRANTPQSIRKLVGQFRSARFMNLHQTGQLDAYLPRWLQPAGRLADQAAAALGLPGPMLVVRLEK